MSTQDNGGSAFPQDEWSCDASDYLIAGGMTLRDYFAAKAMQGILSDAEVTRVMASGERSSTEELCSAAYSFADAMLKARQS
jgi:hypothetical protein